MARKEYKAWKAPDQLSSSNPQTPVSQQSYRRVPGLKRRSDISYSVSGANLRKKRRLNPGQSVSNLAADMNKKDYVKHLGLSEGSKIVSEVMMEWPDYDPECGSKEEWRVKMLNPNEWGDQIVLHLASNLLEHSESRHQTRGQVSRQQDTGKYIFSTSVSQTSCRLTTRVSGQGKSVRLSPALLSVLSSQILK